MTRMYLKSAAMALPAFLLGVAASSALADVIVLKPSQDTSLFGDEVNYASGAGDLFIGNTAGSSIRRSLLRFDLSAIDAGMKVIDASLTVVVNRVAAGAFTAPATLHRVTQSWGEGGSNPGGSGGGDQATDGEATWTLRFFGDATSAWTTPGASYDTDASASTVLGGTGSYSWTGAGMVSDLNDWLANPASNYGWALIGDETNARSARRIYSRETAQDFLRPQLELTLAPIPEPSTYAMFGVGALILALGLRRSSNQR
jgi:hypothetical protein